MFGTSLCLGSFMCLAEAFLIFGLCGTSVRSARISDGACLSIALSHRDRRPWVLDSYGAVLD